jgi:hypothetical protein
MLPLATPDQGNMQVSTQAPKKGAPSGAALGQELWSLELPYFANSSHQPDPTPSTIQRRPQFRSE